MVASRLVEDTLAQVRAGQLTPDTATKALGRLCVCGIFNPDRCTRLLDAAAGPPGEAGDGR